MRIIRERDVEDHLKRRCREMGFELRKVKWIGRRSAPDRRIVGHCWVELKAPGRVATQAQEREHNLMRKAGEDVVVINSIAQVDSLVRMLQIVRGSRK